MQSYLGHQSSPIATLKRHLMLYLISQDFHLFFQLVNKSLTLLVRHKALSSLQFLLKARNVVLPKLDNHTAGVDELVFLSPGLLELSHLLEQHLSAVNSPSKYPCTGIKQKHDKRERDSTYPPLLFLLPPQMNSSHELCFVWDIRVDICGWWNSDLL